MYYVYKESLILIYSIFSVNDRRSTREGKGVFKFGQL